MGAGKAGWKREEWIPLCPHHHDLVDRRLGVSPYWESMRRTAVEIIERKLSGDHRP